MHYFVTGTDTDSGKTFVSSAILAAVSKHFTLTGSSKTTAGFKPIASGCDYTEKGLRNCDALALMQHSTKVLDYHTVNSIRFEPAIAPHIAARQIDVELSVEIVKQHLNKETLSVADFCLVEGAGGWRLPLNNDEFLSEVVADLGLSVILVVGMKLGCLNHAVLTQEVILNDGLKIAGWVANAVDESMTVRDENIESLKSMMKSPFLGFVPHLKDAKVDEAAESIDIKPLLA